VNGPSLDRTGRTLSTSNGAWIPSGNTYGYGWQRCDVAVVSCAQVPGRTGNTYLLTTADIGKRIRSVVSATAGVLGTTTTTSDATAPIAASPPLNLTPPTVSGSSTSLTSTLGTWSDPGPVSYTRQWQICTGSGSLTCQNAVGRTGATYPLGRTDDGKFLRVVVSADGLGIASLESAPFGPIKLPSTPGGGGGDTGGEPNDKDTVPPATVRKLRPFPKVVIEGRLARGLTFISGLRVRRGPRGAAVAVTCRGRGCPRGRFRGKLNRSGALRLRRFQRIYGPGAVIEIRITKRGAIGKYTRVRVKARSIPGRRDLCLMPGVSKPRRCP
jgi:hypothetical protein